MDKVKTAIVGCGGISRAHVNGLSQLHGADASCVDIVATCDLVGDLARERAVQISDFQGGAPKVYTDLDEMLEKESPEAVDICTEHRSHHKIALKCIEAGTHVLVEEPLGVTMRACRAMIDAADQEGVILAVAENYRRNSENRAIHWAVETGKIGDPRMVFWQQLNYSLGSWGWRHDKLKAGGGWILDGGVHYADLFIYNLGPVREVCARTETLEDTRYDSWPRRDGPRPYTVEDLSIALLEFESGASGIWSWSNVAPGEGLDQRVIYGSAGSVGWNRGLTTEMENPWGQRVIEKKWLVSWMLDEMEQEEKDRLFPGGIGLRDDFSSTVGIEIWDFARAIREGTSPEVDGRLGAQAEAVPMAIYESSAIGEKVKVEDVLECRVEAYQDEINRDLGL